MKTSVIIAAYKAQDFLEECLDSVFIQDHVHEVLLSIDSCEDTLSEIKRIRHKYDPRLKVYSTEKNIGPYPQFNQLIKMSEGDYLLFFGADDIMRPGMIKTLDKLKGDSDLLQFMCLNFGNVSDSRIGKVYFPGGVKLFKKDIFRVFGGFPSDYLSADSDLAYRMETFSNAIRIKKVSNVLFDRRIHETNLTRLKPPKFRDKSYKLKRYASILDVYFEPEEIEMVEI